MARKSSLRGSSVLDQKFVAYTTAFRVHPVRRGACRDAGALQAPRNKQRDFALGGRTTEELLALGLHKNDLLPHVLAALEDVRAAEIEYHFMGYCTHWRVQDRYYYAAENSGFKANPERTEGTYTKMSSLDDRIDGSHYFTTYIK